MKNNSIVRGVDEYGRTFVSFKMLVATINKDTNAKTEETTVFTLFNRRRESPNTWVVLIVCGI